MVAFHEIVLGVDHGHAGYPTHQAPEDAGHGQVAVNDVGLPALHMAGDPQRRRDQPRRGLRVEADDVGAQLPQVGSKLVLPGKQESVAVDEVLAVGDPQPLPQQHLGAAATQALDQVEDADRPAVERGPWSGSRHDRLSYPL